MLRRPALLLALLLVPLAARGQEPQTEAAARAAVIASLLARRDAPDSTRIASDSASMYRDFVRCKEVDGRSICALTDNKPVTMVTVRLVSPESASVEIRYYAMFSQSCPPWRPYEVPIISYGRIERFTAAYRDGKWRPDASGRGIEC